MSDFRRRNMNDGWSTISDWVQDAFITIPLSRSQSGQRTHQHASAAAPFGGDNRSTSPISKAGLARLAPEVSIARSHRRREAASWVRSPSGEERTRVDHACEQCRHRKRKCSGERPSCTQCEDFELTCVYGEKKIEKSRK
jgi:hypothetical protein